MDGSQPSINASLHMEVQAESSDEEIQPDKPIQAQDKQGMENGNGTNGRLVSGSPQGEHSCGVRQPLLESGR